MKTEKPCSTLQELKYAMNNFLNGEENLFKIKNLYTDFYLDQNKKNKKLEKAIENLRKTREELEELEFSKGTSFRIRTQKTFLNSF